MDERDNKAMNEELNPPLREAVVSGWVAVTDALPKPLQTVWLINGKGWVCLGCLVESDGGWHWAESNGVMYIENDEIVSECESEDLDVNFWHEIPKPPCKHCNPNRETIIGVERNCSECGIPLITILNESNEKTNN